MKNIELIAEGSFIHEYAHHPYQIEHYLSQFMNSSEEYKGSLSLDTYVNVLAPTPLRAKKNSLISFLTIYCRVAIDSGLPAERSFSVSDYFINEIEKATTEKELKIIFDDILYGYKYLVYVSRTKKYSFYTTKALRYIENHLYDPLKVNEIAEHLGINVRYFSTLFTRDVGVAPSTYIQNEKIKKAKLLLSDPELSVNEIADLLHFTDASHFCKVFKKHTGITPGKFRNKIE